MSKLMGFIKQMVTASAFGATLETDLISLSQGFIGNIQYVIVQVLLTSFVSIYIHFQETDKDSAGHFAGDVIRVFLCVAGVIVAVLLAFAPYIARIIAPSYDAAASARLTGYLRLFSPVLLLFVLIAVYHALLNANARFLPGQMDGIHQSLSVILLVVFFQKTLGVQVLTVSFFVYILWNTVFLGIMSRKYRTRSTGDPFKNPAVRQLLRMAAPLFLGYAMVYINQQVDKILVSGLDTGTVTAMGYAAVLSNLVGTFITTFASVLFPYITTSIARQQHERAAQMVHNSTVLLTAAFLPITIITVFCAEDVVSVAFGRGAFDAKCVETAGFVLMGYAFSFVPLVLQEIFSRFHYGYQDSRRPMINSTIGICCNIVLSIALCPYWGAFGVAFASSVSTLICGVLDLLHARKHNSFFHVSAVLRPLPLLILGGVACALTAQWGVGHWAASSALIRFLLVTLASGGVYAVVVCPIVIKTLREKKQMRNAL